MNIGSLILAAARPMASSSAVTFGDKSYSYADLSKRCLSFAGALVAKGLKPGDRVLLRMHNCAEYVEVLLGCWAAGIVVVPINAKLHQNEVAHIVGDSGARLVLSNVDVDVVETDVETIPAGGPDYQALLDAEPLAECAQTRPEDLAWLFYTSGTTGRPKGAMLSNRNLLSMANAYLADVAFVGPEDTMLVTAPMSHGAGLYTLPVLLKGGHVVVMPGFDIAMIEDALRRHERVSFFAVPTILNRLVAAWSGTGVPVDRIGTIVYGGAPMYVADLERAIGLFGTSLFQLFAQGETPMTVSGLPKRLHRLDQPGRDRLLSSCGYPRTGVSIQIGNPESEMLVPAGEAGEICAQSDAVMLGYWNNPDATAATLRGGWLRTGDIGYQDADGLLHVVDRSKDMIISGGTNIYPREVEEVLLTHPAVREVAVVGAPDPDWGESVVAFVVCADGAHVDEAQLDAHVCAQIARFKRPKAYRFVPELPKSDYAKILKSELRKLLEGETAQV